MNSLIDSKIDPMAFKKVVSLEAKKKDDSTLGLELRHLWIARMGDHKEEFRKAAMSWAGITNGTLKLEGINPFCNGINPPSIISLPHIAAQALLAKVPSTLPYPHSSIHGSRWPRLKMRVECLKGC
jgi:hypothetical protein